MNLFRYSLSLLSLLVLSSLAACESSEDKFSRLSKRAESYLEQGNLEEARITLLSAIDLKPSNAESYYQLGNVLFAQGKLGAAVENYRSAINFDPKHWSSRVQLATIYLSANPRQDELAENHIRKLIEIKPNDREALVLKSNLAHARKNYKEARKIVEPILANDSEYLPAVVSMAFLEMSENNLNKAETLLRKVISLDDKNDLARMALAEMYSRQGRGEEAEEIIHTLVSTNPDNSNLRYRYSEFLLKTGKGDQAFDEYKKVLEGDPLNHNARDRLYDVYLLRRQNEKAQALYTELSQSNPNNPGTHYFKARNLKLENKLDQALASYLKAIEGLPNFAPAFRRAGILEIAKGEVRVGIEHLTQAIAINPQDIGARIALAKVLVQRGERIQALEHVRTVLRTYPDQLAANILYADIALLEKDNRTARIIYEKLVEVFPNTPMSHYKLALLEEQEGNTEKAIELYKKTISFDQKSSRPIKRVTGLMVRKKGLNNAMAELIAMKAKSSNHVADFNLVIGALYASKQTEEDFGKARKYIQTALEQKPSLFEGYFYLASLDAAKGDINAAVANYRSIIKQNPKSTIPRMLVGIALEQQQKYSEAAVEYRELLKYAPRFGPAANNLAWVIAEHLNGDLDEALKYAKLAKERLPEVGSAADTLGWVYYLRGSAILAQPYIEEAIDLEKRNKGKGNVNPEIYYHLAKVYSELDKKNQAKQLLQQLVSKTNEKNFPKYKEAKELLGKL